MSVDNSFETKSVENFYNTNQILSNVLWHRAFHYGIWENGTQNISDALLNTNHHVANLLDINTSDRVLDMGCGAGETSIFIAKKFGAQVTGITLSEIQCRQAKKRAENFSVSDKADFLIMDYTKTDFPDNSFTKIFAIESFCHALDKRAFLKEAFRLLKPNGKMVISDFFFSKAKDEGQKKRYDAVIRGWAVPRLSTVEELKRDFSHAGFGQVRVYDKSKEIIKSINLMYLYAVVLFPFSWFGRKIRVIPEAMHGHCISCIYQREMFRENMMVYYMVTAQK